MKQSRCSTCGRPITWVLTVLGRKMPIDPEPSSDGNLMVCDDVVVVHTSNCDGPLYKRHLCLDGTTAITTQDLAWSAGLFEGEGTIRINKPTRRNLGALCVSVVNTDIQVVNWFQNRWPGYMKQATGLRPDQKKAWVWVIAARKAVRFLQQIQPYVVRDIVREKIDHALIFQEQKKPTQEVPPDKKYAYLQEQWEAYWWMRELNKRGVCQDPEV